MMEMTGYCSLLGGRLVACTTTELFTYDSPPPNSFLLTPTITTSATTNLTTTGYLLRLSAPFYLPLPCSWEALCMGY